MSKINKFEKEDSEEDEFEKMLGHIEGSKNDKEHTNNNNKSSMKNKKEEEE